MIAPQAQRRLPVQTTDPVEALRHVPLFSDLNQRELKRLARLCDDAEFEAGTTVLRQGQQRGIVFFVIIGGEATVSIDDAVVARLGPGEHFGALALISEGLRSATVTAETPLRCLGMSFWDFRGFVKENADVAWKLLVHVADLLAAERERSAAAVDVA
jgi:CRP-like cAMP-binding protein